MMTVENAIIILNMTMLLLSASVTTIQSIMIYKVVKNDEKR
jgi:hypothetical protein